MNLKEKIKLFKKFASKNEVKWYNTNNRNDANHIYCSDCHCSECCIRNDCEGSIFFSDDEIPIIKEKYPEYFI